MTKLILFIVRVALIIISVIFSKCLFMSWYFSNWNLEFFISNIYDFSSALISVGCIASNLTRNFLDNTPFNIHLKDLWDLIWFSNKNSKSVKLDFFNSTLPLNIINDNGEFSTKPSYIPSDINFSTIEGNSGGSGTSNSSSSFDINSLNKLIEEQKRQILGIQKLIEESSSNTKSEDIKEKMVKISNLYNESQKLRIEFLTNNINLVSKEKSVEIKYKLRSLHDIYSEYRNNFNSLPRNDELKTLKREFDLTNNYTKKGNQVLVEVSKDIQQNIKNNNKDLWGKLNKDVFQKYNTEIENYNKRNKILKNETSKLLDQKKEK